MQRRRHNPVTLQDVISTGLIQVGQVFFHGGTRAVITATGMQVDHGHHFVAPTPAAESVNGGTEINGWDYWKDALGRTLNWYRRQHPLSP